MKTIYLVTSNPGKVESFSNILKKHNLPISIEMLNGEYVENKDLGTTEGVVLDGAKMCAEKYQKPVLVQDTGLFIEALNGFPGVNTKFFLEKIGNEGIIKLMEGVEARDCERIFSLGYCQPGQDPIAFNGVVKGSIATQLRGKNGFGFDPIFIPKGHNKTFAEDTETRDRVSPFNDTILEVVREVVKESK